MSVERYGRIRTDKRRFEPLRFEDMARAARAATEVAGSLWAKSEATLTGSEVERERGRDVVRGTLEELGVVRLDGRMVGIEGSASMLDAMRWVLGMGATELRAPRTSADPWIVKMPAESRYRGAILNIYPDSEGTPVAHVVRDAVEAAPLQAAAAREGLDSIDALIAHRASQRAAISQPDRPDEDLDQAVERMHKRRLLAADDAATGGVGFLVRGEELFAEVESKDKLARRELERARKAPPQEEQP